MKSLMLNRFVSILCFSFVVFCGHGQNLPVDIKRVCSGECDENFIVVSILRSDKLATAFPKKVFDNYYDFNKHGLNLSDKNQYRNLLKDINKYYYKYSNKIYIINDIKTWCNENKFINDLSVSPEAPPEAILYNTTRTKHLVEKYIVDNKKQGWYSLSSVQLYELNIDFLNYFDSLDIDKRKELNFELKQTSSRFNKNGKF